MPFLFLWENAFIEKGVKAIEKNRKYGNTWTMSLRVNWMMFTLVNLRLPTGKHSMGAKTITSSINKRYFLIYIYIRRVDLWKLYYLVIYHFIWNIILFRIRNKANNYFTFLDDRPCPEFQISYFKSTAFHFPF